MRNLGLWNVVITDCDLPSTGAEEKELEGIAEVRRYQCADEDEILDIARDADALIIQYAPITRRVLDRLPRCKVISRYGIGLDMIDLQAAKEKNIPVLNVSDYCIEEVSDHVLSLILAAARKLIFHDANVRRGLWNAVAAGDVRRMKDCTVGLAGFGNIPRLVAKKLSGFGCEILAYDPFVDGETVLKHGAVPVSVEDLLRKADFLSLHLPLNDKTRRMFNLELFGRMKKNAVLVNTSRGGVVDEEDLLTALEGGLIAGACLDVFEAEPIPPDHPLLKLDCVLATPHAAFYSQKSQRELQIKTARNIADFLKKIEKT